MEAGLLGLEHEVVLSIRLEQLHDCAPSNRVVEAMVEKHAKVGAPLAEVVIAIDHGYARLPRAQAQRRGCPCGRQRTWQQLFAAVELEVIDPIDEEQRDGALVRRA